MGKQNSIIKEKEQQKEKAIVDFLMNKKSMERVKSKETKNSIFSLNTYFTTENANELKDYIVRPYEGFVFKSKSKDSFRLNKEVLVYFFEKFAVPVFLRPKKVSEISYSMLSEDANCQLHTWGNIVQWYLTHAQGGSLYKKYFKGLLTKKESHTFINQNITENIGDALVYSVAFSVSNNYSLSSMLAKTKIGEYIEKVVLTKNLSTNKDKMEAFQTQQRKEINEYFHMIRLFMKITEKYSINEFNDIFDYLKNKWDTDVNYTIVGKGYNLSILKKATNDWHHELRRNKQSFEFAGKIWNGYGYGEQYITADDKDDERVIYYFTEILDGKALDREGKAQRHCVYSYLKSCMNGECSIVRLHTGGGKSLVTMEVKKNIYGYVLVQARRFCNQVPREHEKKIIMKWAKKNNISIGRTIF